MKIINDDNQQVDVPVFCKKCGSKQNELNRALRHIMLTHSFDYARWYNSKARPKKLTVELTNEMMLQFYSEAPNDQ